MKYVNRQDNVTVEHQGHVKAIYVDGKNIGWFRYTRMRWPSGEVKGDGRLFLNHRPPVDLSCFAYYRDALSFVFEQASQYMETEQ